MVCSASSTMAIWRDYSRCDGSGPIYLLGPSKQRCFASSCRRYALPTKFHRIATIGLAHLCGNDLRGGSTVWRSWPAAHVTRETCKQVDEIPADPVTLASAATYVFWADQLAPAFPGLSPNMGIGPIEEPQPLAISIGSVGRMARDKGCPWP